MLCVVTFSLCVCFLMLLILAFLTFNCWVVSKAAKSIVWIVKKNKKKPSKTLGELLSCVRFQFALFCPICFLVLKMHELTVQERLSGSEKHRFSKKLKAFHTPLFSGNGEFEEEKIDGWRR